MIPENLWNLLAQAGIQVLPDHDPAGGYVWHIVGVRDWADPFPTREAALVNAVTWLVQRAKEFQTVDLMAASDAELFKMWIKLLQRARL